MAGVFACPECGKKLAVEGLSPGREVQCEECLTWVEVPFLPRATAPKRGRRTSLRSPWASRTLQGAIVFAVVVLLGLMATRMIGGRVRSDKERVLAELVASADQAESSHRYDVALREIESALAHARSFERESSGRLLELKSRRDRVSLCEAKARLAGVEALDPEAAVGEALTLVAKAKEDHALAPLAGMIEDCLAESRMRRVESDLGLARRAFEAGRDAEAFTLADRLYSRAKDLPDADARRYGDEAEALLGAVVGRSGVMLPLIAGRFVAGSAEGYASSLDRFRAEALKARGFLPQPRRSPWASLWDEKAPFVQTVEIAESQDGLYLQSKNRTTLIDGTFELLHKDQVVWKDRVVARTRSPLPDLPAYLAGHLATASKRNPEVEQRLHADALTQFAEQAVRKLRGLPTREAATRVP
jgi:hypothetical protein